MRHVVECTFNGRCIVIFSREPAQSNKMILDEIRSIHYGGGFGSIIGRNSFQRRKSDALQLFNAIMEIYGEIA